MALDIYLNGEFLPKDQATISVFDRGFLFGDGVYEVIPVYAGKLFRFDQHIERLNNSLAAILIKPPLLLEEWRSIAEQLIAQLPGRDQSLYLQVTRGTGHDREHAIPHDIEPNLLAMTRLLGTPDENIKSHGISVVTLDNDRWKHCNIKAITLLPNLLAKHRAKQEHADEAILVRDGKAHEGAASNLFIVKDGLLITPPKSDMLLPGITRDLVLELARHSGSAYCEADIHVDDLEEANEIWITSSSKEIAPVVSLNGNPVGDGQPGPLWKNFDALFDACKERLRIDGECR
ncbi:D-amino acid aminotransferase [Solemya elarraichensis gill symbiont]|uniref:Aminodeoxychorismate lyase n=1 Tax=Solemya elarraichensis gill symbiont TaxID=1918949 RepID=A0A1T2L7C5_9GAMM|nr:D-amino acid aminotransferase [Solemya elarraichensis gill symbiont]OOZ40846.1 D-amino acid aminotransferase [Solemya elarraichensis gill symbiont]